MSIITLPGLIDPHVHLRTPGQEYKEDFTTGTKAAIAGGFTTVLDMPNNQPLIDSLSLLEAKKNLASGTIYSDIGFYFGTTGTNTSEFENVKTKVFGMKIYLSETTGSYTVSTSMLDTIYDAWKPTGKPILLHAEDELVEKVLASISLKGIHTHVCHVSSRTELEPILKAKDEGLPVSCGVTAHHLFLTQEDIPALGPLGHMKPYLKSKEDQDFLWKHLERIDMVESDHAPHTLEEKQSDHPPYGVPGLETTLPLLLTAVHEGRMTIQDIVRLCFDGPRTLFSIPTDQSTMVEIDPDYTYTIERKNLKTKCAWSPFEGKKVTGKVRSVILRGQTILADDVLHDIKKGHVL